MTQLSTAAPMKARVLKHLDGGFALVEVPIIVATPSLDLSKTGGGGKGKISLSVDDFHQMVENFASWPKPVAVGFDGFDGHQTERGGPQAVFVNSIKVKGDALWGQMECNAWATSMIVGDKAYRGFSLEAERNTKTPTKNFKGWVLTGGLFTNNCATDTQFKIAATGDTVADESITVTTTLTNTASAEGDTEMSDENKAAEAVAATPTPTPAVAKAESVSLVYHEQEVGKVRDTLTASESATNSLRAKLAAVETEVKALRLDASTHATSSVTVEGEKAALTATVNRLELETKALRESRDQLAQKVNEQADELGKIRADSVASEVKAIITEAIDGKVPPAVFTGWEADPAAWLTSKYASVEAFRDQVNALRGVAASSAGSALKSGHDPKKAAEAKEQLTEQEQEVFESLNLGDGDFVGVKDEKEARKIFLARKANK